VIGRKIKHYEIVDILGRGGMGVVYRARDERLDRSVALKVLPKELSEEPDRKRRFLLEARAACAVSHPAIAQVYDVDEIDDMLFIVMELVEGQTVRSLIQGRELDVLGAIEIARQVASGLAKAHDAGIVHRDIKSENVMVTTDGHAKILDFGLAKLLDAAGGSGGDLAGDLSHMETVAKTQAGLVLGTLRYMSPEQARGQVVDHRSDIFSFGVVLYEMVTGQLPFQGNTPVDTLHAIAFEETRPVTTIRANVPPSLQRVITRCLRKRAQDRYDSAQEIVRDLKDVQRDVESGVTTVIPIAQRLRERLGAFRELPLGEKKSLLIGAVLLGAVTLGLLRAGEDLIPMAIIFGGGGLLTWRRYRNRRYRLMRKFSARVQKLPEVLAVTVVGQSVTVVADKALAKTYVRVNAAMELVNAKMFFGDPFSVTVVDGVGEEDLKTRLSEPGVVYVRPEALSDES
jgi:tRNA A-37 threonylcarbamoyl transferase component Bud32